MNPTNADVVIAGAGPCGLMLALELGARGIRTLVLDREAGVATAPQANATQARSMEHYRRHGFAQEIRQLGMPGDHPTDLAYSKLAAGRPKDLEYVGQLRRHGILDDHLLEEWISLADQPLKDVLRTRLEIVRRNH